jgi:glycosyltransferase involved in cell wall biosynthesis
MAAAAPHRVAIVHDWLVSMRGAERLLECLCRLYPQATIYTLCCDRAQISPMLRQMDIRTSFIDRLSRLPGAGGRFRALLPLFPLAVESFDLGGYDLVISTTHCVAKGVIPDPTALHISYVHAPMRYIWDERQAYQARAPIGAVGRAALTLSAHYLRMWDVTATARADLLVANSGYTRRKLNRYYGRDAVVLHPPVQMQRFGGSAPASAAGSADAEGSYDLVVSALVPYKRVELAVRAYARNGLSLVVVGEGPDRDRLAALAPANVELRGKVSDDELVQLYRGCRALVHPALDDFGIAPLEAMAAGKPVVAFKGGGACETVIEGETGVFFDEPTDASLAAAVEALGRRRFEPRRLAEHAATFDEAHFERRFAALVNEAWEQHQQRPSIQSSTGRQGLRLLAGRS